MGGRTSEHAWYYRRTPAKGLAAVLAYNRRVWRPRQAAARVPGDGLKVSELAAPVASLAAVLLVFVLVQTYGSWASVGRAETAEATATLLLFREADLVADARLRDRIHRQVVCYARSVVRQGWPAMGRRRISSVPTYWASRVRGEGIRLVLARGSSTAGESLVMRDGERATARQNRLGEARSTVPGALSWLMLAVVAVVLAVLGAATMHAVDTRVHAVLVVAAAAFFAGTLLLIRDLDQPYSGLVHRAPTQTAFIVGQIAAELRGPLPCDAGGLPTHAPGFRATTTTLG
jgi:hypothetical protein